MSVWYKTNVWKRTFQKIFRRGPWTPPTSVDMEKLREIETLEHTRDFAWKAIQIYKERILKFYEEMNLKDVEFPEMINLFEPINVLNELTTPKPSVFDSILELYSNLEKEKNVDETIFTRLFDMRRKYIYYINIHDWSESELMKKLK